MLKEIAIVYLHIAIVYLHIAIVYLHIAIVYLHTSYSHRIILYIYIIYFEEAGLRG